MDKSQPQEGQVLVLNPNREVWRRRLDRGAVEMSKQQERWADDGDGDMEGAAAG